MSPTTGATQSGSSGTTSSSTQTTAATDPLANESTFLTLLVSQLQNQDPMSPVDSNEFVSQLTSYSQLEQMIGIHSDTTNLVTDLGGTSSTTSSNSNSGSTTPTSGN